MSGRYIVSWRRPFTTRWSKTHSESLSGSLIFAWRRHAKGCSVDNIKQGLREVVGSEVLAQVLTEMDNLIHEDPKRPLAEVAAQVIEGIDIPEAGQ